MTGREKADRPVRHLPRTAAAPCGVRETNSSDPARHLLRVALASALALSLLLPACGHNKILGVNPSTGYFIDMSNKAALPDTAVVTLNRPFDLDSRRGLVVVPDHVSAFVTPARPDFTLNMVREIAYFDEVMSFRQLRKLVDGKNIHSEELSRAFSADDEPAVMRAIAKAWRPFLWLHWEHRENSKAHRDEYYQLILTDALTLENLFTVETHYHYAPAHPHLGSGRMAQYRGNHYPMLNALIDYIKERSQFYRRQDGEQDGGRGGGQERRQKQLKPGQSAGEGSGAGSGKPASRPD